MSDLNNINKQIQKTKNTTEQLKARLQNLVEFRNPDRKQNEKENVNLAAVRGKQKDASNSRNSKSFHQNQISDKNKSVLNGNVSTSSKIRNYDIHEAREYIRKQRESRSQTKPSDNKLKEEMRKQKLQQLHQKAQELVIKNVQLSRQRSKSREKRDFIRLDGCNQLRNRSLSREKNTLLKHETKGIGQSVDNVKHTSNIPSIHLNTVPQVRIRSDKSINYSEESEKLQESKQKFGQTSNVSVRSEDYLNMASFSNDPKKAANINILSNITLRKPSSPPIKSPIEPTKNVIPIEQIVCTQEDQKNVFPKSQSNTKNITYPVWLQEAPEPGNALNFINTVKRKLQYTLSSSKTGIDVGVQSSLYENDQHGFQDVHESIQNRNIADLLNRNINNDEATNNKSFNSHQHPKLDVKSIEHLELVPKLKHEKFERGSQKDMNGTIYTRSSLKTTDESESDTSKNIPDISSESGTSLRKNAESVRRNLNTEFNLSINTNKIDKMKLVPQLNSTTTTLRTEVPKTFSHASEESCKQSVIKNKTETIRSYTSENIYVSDFESDDIKKSPYFSKNRDSIISFNSPEYNEVRVVIPLLENSKQSSIKTSQSHSSVHSSNKVPISASSPNDPLPLNLEKTLESSHSDIQRECPLQNEQRFSPNIPKIIISKTLEDPKLDNTKNCNHETEKTNEIHLKFEAEIHLLNDFNQSLRQLNAVEKVVETLKSKNDLAVVNDLQNKDTQTSAASKSSSTGTKSTTRVGEKGNKNSNRSKSEITTVNYSRGTHINENSFDNSIFGDSLLDLHNGSNKSLLSTGLDISHINSSRSLIENSVQNPINFENLLSNNYTGVSLNMFDQLINDEDTRLDHLKMVLKIREKALLDRVRAELAWLEIQRKHYKETGNLQEVSAIKKKQRGIILNHQREKHEMQRIKQMQRAASVERKAVLKEQRNIIRKQLSTDKMLGKMKLNPPKKRNSPGPLKVLQSHTESVLSETSISRKSSTDREEIYSVRSHHSISKVSEISEIEIAAPKTNPYDIESLKTQQNIKRTLLMREAALRKRRKEAEELLQWNQKLLEEEKRINELELKASSIIRQQHNTTVVPEEKYTFNGKQLNKLWYNLTGCEENKFSNEQTYRMSQIALERFCKSAREYSVKKKLLSKSSNSEYSVADISVSENVPKSKTVESASVPSETDLEKDNLFEKSVSNVTSLREYTSDFEVDTTDNVVDVDDIEVNENIDELIHNFSRIEDDISSLGSKHSHSSVATEVKKKESLKSNKIVSNVQISVTETDRTLKDIHPPSTKRISLTLEKPIIQDDTRESLHDEPSVNDNSQLNISVIPSGKSSKKDVIVNESKNSVNESSVNVSESFITNVTSAEKSNIANTTSYINVSNKSNTSVIPTGNSSENDILIDENISKNLEDELSIEDKVDASVIFSVKSSKQDVTGYSDTLKKCVNEPSENNSDKLNINDDVSKSHLNTSKNITNVSLTTETQDNLNESKEILLILGETDVTIAQNYQERNIDKQTTAENVDTSEEILSTLNQIVELISYDKNITDSALINLSIDDIPDKEISIVKSLLKERSQDLNTSENILTLVPDSVANTNLLIDEHCTLINSFNSEGDIPNKILDDCHDISESKSFDEENRVTRNGVELTLQSIADSNFDPSNEAGKETDVKVELSFDPNNLKKTDEKVADSLTEYGDATAIDDENPGSAINENLNSRLGENNQSDKQNTDEIEEDAPTSKINAISDHSTAKSHREKHSSATISSEPYPESAYEELNDRHKEIVAQQIPIASNNSIANETEDKLDISSESVPSKRTDGNEILNEFDSTNKADRKKFNQTPSIDNTSLSAVTCNERDFQENIAFAIDADKSEHFSDLSSKNENVSVKKRVSEIMADANQVSKSGDKSPRLQDFYTTTYDLVSPTTSPELGSPVNEKLKIAALSSIFDNEAEEILKKQLAIEQEIKQITEQQQKQQMPFMYVREIPNKPPPPYTPPSSTSGSVSSVGVIPTIEEIDEITKYSAKILHKAYLSNNLDNISVSNNTLSLISKDIPKEKYKFVFDLCKDLSKDHYKQFKVEKCPSWMQVCKKPQLIIVKPFEVNELEKYMGKKLRELFSYQKAPRRENAIIKWSRKKRDHVDEILIEECQAEEDQWINYEKDELLVLNQITEEIMNSLLKETAHVFSKIFSRHIP